MDAGRTMLCSVGDCPNIPNDDASFDLAYCLAGDGSPGPIRTATALPKARGGARQLRSERHWELQLANLVSSRGDQRILWFCELRFGWVD